MYVHVPAAWLAFLAFFVVFVMSVLYLIQRDLRWDRVAQSSAEIGVVFTVLTLALGSMWGKPTWGVWWTWDPRLTTTAIMLAIYVGYLAIPLSVGMFPHIFMHWLTARRAGTFRVSIVGYPLCVAAVWLPSVLLGLLGSVDVPGLEGPAASSILASFFRSLALRAVAALLEFSSRTTSG